MFQPPLREMPSWGPSSLFPFRCAELLCFNHEFQRCPLTRLWVSIPLRGIAVFQRVRWVSIVRTRIVSIPLRGIAVFQQGAPEE